MSRIKSKLAPLSIKGAERTTIFHHKSLDGQMGSVIIHKGATFFLTRDGGLVSAGRSRLDNCPHPVVDGIALDIKNLDPEVDQVINGRFHGWQEGAEHWLWIVSGSAAYMVRYQKV